MLFATHIDSLDAMVINPRKYELSLLRQMLAYAGVKRVRCYDDPADALRELLQEPSGLIIIDQDLPRIYSCPRLIRGLRQSSLVPICLTAILVTSTAPSRSFVHTIMQSGANSVLVRPFSTKSLQMRILRALADRPKLENRNGHYIVAEIVDSMEARELSSNPFKLASVLNGGELGQAFGDVFDGLITNATAGRGDGEMPAGDAGSKQLSDFDLEWRKPRRGNLDAVAVPS
jgi:DNA-binding response OmpR family regulator